METEVSPLISHKQGIKAIASCSTLKYVQNVAHNKKLIRSKYNKPSKSCHGNVLRHYKDRLKDGTETQ